MKLQPSKCLAVLMGLMLASAAYAAGDDLTLTKKITAGGTNISATTSVQGARERTSMDIGTGAAMVTIHQCDLKRTLTVNDAQKTYMVKSDLEEGDNSKAAAAALLGAAAPAPEQGGTIAYTMSVKDTGEKKQIQGFTAKHLKTTVVAQPSENACNRAKQKYEIDGWYVDIKDSASCQRFSPYQDRGDSLQGCKDRVVLKMSGGSVRPGMAVLETVTLTNGDEQPMVITTEVTELKKGPLAKELFDLPAGYREVKTTAELYGMPAMPQMAQAGANVPPNANVPPQAQYSRGNTPSMAQMMNPANQLAVQRQVFAQAQQLGVGPTGASPMDSVMAGMGGMGAPAGTSPVAAPQVLGPKAAGKIRIGVAPPDTQLGQGNNAGADYSTPVRNAVVALMNGPAVEIAALDSRVPVQLQAEAQQKQCDFILYSSVAVKHNSGGGFGKLMKMAPMVTPMAGLGGSMGGAVAAQAAGAAASAGAMSAQQQALSQLAGFNGQIKSKDDVTVQYQLNPTGQGTPQLQNTLKGKAKSDGDDVLTPLLQQAANSILTEVTKK